MPLTELSVAPLICKTNRSRLNRQTHFFLAWYLFKTLLDVGYNCMLKDINTWCKRIHLYYLPSFPIRLSKLAQNAPNYFEEHHGFMVSLTPSTKCLNKVNCNKIPIGISPQRVHIPQFISWGKVPWLQYCILRTHHAFFLFSFTILKNIKRSWGSTKSQINPVALSSLIDSILSAVSILLLECTSLCAS